MWQWCLVADTVGGQGCVEIESGTYTCYNRIKVTILNIHILASETLFILKCRVYQDSSYWYRQSGSTLSLSVCLLQAVMLHPVHSALLKYYVHNHTFQHPPSLHTSLFGKRNNKRVNKLVFVGKTIQ